MQIRSLYILIFLIFISPALKAQYIDPGSGSYILQLLLGAFLVLVFYYKVIIYKVKAFFAYLFKSKKDKDAS